MILIIIIAALAASLALIVVAMQRQRRPQAAGQDQSRRLEQLTSVGVSPQVAHYIANGDRLKAVKAYRSETGIGLKEATSYIDTMMKQADQ